ncbi:hypothetical protein D3C76_1288010 [compost metagenome]
MSDGRLKSAAYSMDVAFNSSIALNTQYICSRVSEYYDVLSVEFSKINSMGRVPVFIKMTKRIRAIFIEARIEGINSIPIMIDIYILKIGDG